MNVYAPRGAGITSVEVANPPGLSKSHSHPEERDQAENTEKKTLAEEAVTLSDERLKSLEANRRNAMQAVCKFVDDVDEAALQPSTRRHARESSTPPWTWPTSSARRSWSSGAASPAASVRR